MMTKQNFTKVGIIAAVLFLNACQQLPVRNPFNMRQEAKLGPIPQEMISQDQTQVRWVNTSLGKQQRFSKLKPLVSGQAIYAGDYSGKIVALDKASGKTIWQNSTGKKIISGPALVDNLLVFTTQDAHVLALDASSGHEMWTAQTSSAVLSPATGGKGTLMVHAIDGSVLAYHSKTGKQKWVVEQSTPALTLHYTSSPVVVNDTVLVGYSSGKFVAMNIHSGMIEWERTISLPHGRSELQRMVDISADPVVVGDIAYVITYQGKLAAVNIVNGNLAWERDISSYQNMAYSKNTLYITDNEHTLWAIHAHTGATLWRQNSLAERYITGPAVVNNQVVVADRGGVVYFVDADKGAILAHKKLSGKFFQNPITMGDGVLAANYKGKLAWIQSYKASS